MNLELLRKRAQIIGEVRSFFDSRQYLSVDTPLLAPDLIPESCLEVFETSWLPPNGSKQQPEEYWLIPSPEIWMKQLIARHGVNMYQVCKCFRNTESRGYLHNPEFTMLEYYTINADYLDSLALTEDLFNYLVNRTPVLDHIPDKIKSALKPPFMQITMEEAFSRWAGFSLEKTAKSGKAAMEKEARRLGLEHIPNTTNENAAIALLYDLMFIHSVEPSLPKNRPVVILDYPAFVPCLAKNKKHHGKNVFTKERWELYVNGIELANCYSEETDPEEVRRFFEEEAEKKEQNALIKHRINRDYWKFFLPRQKTAKKRQNNAFPCCTGVALGLDRLIMAFTGKSNIAGALPF